MCTVRARSLHTHCVSKTLFRQYDKLNGTRTKPVQVFGFNCPLKTRITPAQQTAQDPHSSCTKLLHQNSLENFGTCYLPNCTGTAPFLYMFAIDDSPLENCTLPS